MNGITITLSGIFGLVLLYCGAEYLVRGGSAIAARSRVSPLVIGLTLVAFGTSAPELFVSAGAALEGLGDICIGNIVGSNICNIALILGLTALVVPVEVNYALFRRDLPVMIGASVLLVPLMGARGRLGRTEGVLLLAVYGGYLAWLIKGL